MEFINWKSYFSKLLNNWLIILLSCIIFAGSAFVYTKYFVTPMYTSTINVNVSNNKGSSDDTSVLDTCIVILEDKITAQKAAELLATNGYEYDAGYVKSVMSYAKVSSSSVLKFSATSSDPKTSELICGAVVAVANDVMQSSYGQVTLKGIGDPTSPKSPSSPNINRSIIIGTLVAIVLVCGLLFLHLILDNTINSESDFKERCEIPVLGVIPSVESVSKEQYGGRYGRKAN